MPAAKILAVDDEPDFELLIRQRFRRQIRSGEYEFQFARDGAEAARDKIVAALGEDPMEQGLQVADSGGDDAGVARMLSAAIARRRIVGLEYYKENEDEFSTRTVEPYALINGREG